MLNFNGVKEFKKDIGYGLEVIELKGPLDPIGGAFLRLTFAQ